MLADDVVDREADALGERLDERLIRQQRIGAGGAVDGAVAGLLDAPRELRDQARLPDAGIRRDGDDSGETLLAGLAKSGG